jgi:hypothetical protein
MQGHLPELKRVIAAYGEHRRNEGDAGRDVVRSLRRAKRCADGSDHCNGTPLTSPAADRARKALDRNNHAMERLKAGDWTGFGTELDAMHGLLENLSRQSTDH